MGKNWIEEAWSSFILINYNRCQQKMLEETENEETRGFFVAFLSLVTFELEAGRGGFAGYAYVLGSLF